MKKLKTIAICTSIIAILLGGIVFFEYLILKLLGLHYHSIGALVFFFIVYLFLEIPLSLITSAIPKALKSLGLIQSSKGLLLFILHATFTFLLIGLLDLFMENIEISIQAALVFALITGFLNWKLSANDEEPPAVDSKEFKEIERRFKG